MMYIKQMLYRFDFDQNSFFNDQINPVTSVYPDGFINHGQGHLVPNLQLALLKFVGQCCFISGLKEAGTKLVINLENGSPDPKGDFIFGHGLKL